MSDQKIESSIENWENGALGRNDVYVRVDDTDLDSLLNQSLGMKAISLRLERSLISDLELIAKHHGLSYQPLMRQVLKRFVATETRRILREYMSESSASPRAV